jgi:uncharacterized protein
MMVLMSEPVPAFRYHPDPVATGSVVAASAPCVVCGLVRGFLYVGPVYAVEEIIDGLCPWCIADGTAASALNAEFTDAADGAPPEISASVVDELSRRTPGYSSWQQDRWLYHCGDGCAFLGAIGRAELDDHPDALQALRHEHDCLGWERSDLDAYIDSLSRDGSPTAYLFRCLRCATHLAFSDFD